MISHRISPVGRRDLLGFAATAFVAAISLRLARAEAAGTTRRPLRSNSLTMRCSRR